MSEFLELADYRRRVSEMYHTVRTSAPDHQTWQSWRDCRDRLFAAHPQTPLEEPQAFTALPYFDFDSSWRTEGRFFPSDHTGLEVDHSGSGSTRFFKVGTVAFYLKGEEHILEVLWLDAYGGGIFVPFRDGTNGQATYGGGRYLLDTVKGADLGQTERGMILDFNYAYHPSCVYSSRWSCPLAPPANSLQASITAGERLQSVT